MQRDSVMSGSLQIEAMLQTLVLTVYTMERHTVVSQLSKVVIYIEKVLCI